MFFSFTKQRRRTIFYLAVLIFFVLAPVLILYSLGYNVDFRTGKLLRMGGIFVKAAPNGFRVILNGKPITESRLLFSGALIVNLRPDLYVVRVEKDGYRPWQKVVHVSAEAVSEFRNIILFPEAFREEQILDLSRRGLSVKEFEVFPGTPWIIIRIQEQQSRTYFFNLEAGTLGDTAAFGEFRWDKKTKRLVVRRTNAGGWTVVSLEGTPLHEERLVFPKTIRDPVFVEGVPGLLGSFLVLDTGGTLYRFNRPSFVAAPILSDIHSFSFIDDKIFFLTTTGFFGVSDENGKRVDRYGRKGFFMSHTPARFGVSVSGDMFTIDSAGGFFVRRRDQQEIMPVSGNVLGATFSEDGERILFWSEHDIQVLFLTDEKNQPFRAAGTREKIVSVSDRPIRWASWFGRRDAYVLFSAGGFVAAADIDSRGEGTSAVILFEGGDELMRYKRDANIVLRAKKGSLFVTKVE